MSPLRAISVMLDALAGWLEDAQAGGLPSKFLVAQAVVAIREISATALAEDELGHFLPGVDQEPRP